MCRALVLIHQRRKGPCTHFEGKTAATDNVFVIDSYVVVYCKYTACFGICGHALGFIQKTLTNIKSSYRKIFLAVWVLQTPTIG